MQMVRQAVWRVMYPPDPFMHRSQPAEEGQGSQPSAEDLLILRYASAFRGQIMPRNGPQIPVI